MCCSIADAVGKYPVAAVEIVVAFIFGWWAHLLTFCWAGRAQLWCCAVVQVPLQPGWLPLLPGGHQFDHQPSSPGSGTRLASSRIAVSLVTPRSLSPAWPTPLSFSLCGDGGVPVLLLLGSATTSLRTTMTTISSATARPKPARTGGQTARACSARESMSQCTLSSRLP